MLDVRLLGPLEVWSDGEACRRLASRNQRLVLTALALEPGHVVSADRLVDLLWPASLPTDPAGPRCAPRCLAYAGVWERREH